MDAIIAWLISMFYTGVSWIISTVNKFLINPMPGIYYFFAAILLSSRDSRNYDISTNAIK